MGGTEAPGLNLSEDGAVFGASSASQKLSDAAACLSGGDGGRWVASGAGRLSWASHLPGPAPGCPRSRSRPAQEKERQRLENLRRKEEAEQLRRQKVEEDKRRRLEEVKL